MTDEGARDDDGVPANELVSRLGVIEGQPLEARPSAYAQIHEELRARLEGGDVTSPRG